MPWVLTECQCQSMPNEQPIVFGGELEYNGLRLAMFETKRLWMKPIIFYHDLPTTSHHLWVCLYIKFHCGLI